jgi:aminoglycoside phosphotransferase (APT) family kinase protein
VRNRDKHDLVFCHNDLSANNVIVDPDSLKIKAIIDWEYAGFYPPEFEAPFYRRPGPSFALEGEVDDVDMLLKMMSRESDF